MKRMHLHARSDKTWVTDPGGVHRETLRTLGEATEYGEDRLPADAEQASTCCGAAPKAEAAACC
jgi:hypothetical protein